MLLHRQARSHLQSMKNVIDFLAIYQRDILWDKSRAFLVALTDVGQFAY